MQETTEIQERSARIGFGQMGLVFTCFVLSGFTGLLYQIVWMRLALARFGVNTSVVAVVVTVFMLGLALGSYLCGRWAEAIEARWGLRGLQLYAIIELAISIGGWTVAILFDGAREVLLSFGAAGSAAYTAASALLLTVILVPFCTAMGATFPAAMSYLRRSAPAGASERSFSYLYLANVVGALAGVLVTALVLIEVLGFHRTLWIAAATNIVIATLASLAPACDPSPSAEGQGNEQARAGDSESAERMGAIFLTGFVSMGMEVVWTRIYPPFIGTIVYSFAGILATYLVATALGSLIYRLVAGSGGSPRPWRVWPALCIAAMLPLFSASPYLRLPGPLRLIVGLAPLCGVLGFLTPALMDAQARGEPERLGRAYALNLVGCVTGPLLAGFVLVPTVGPGAALLLLSLPLFAYLAAGPIRRERQWFLQAGAVVGAVLLFAGSQSFESQFPGALVRHDRTASVIAAGEGMNRQLYVNGESITYMTPITKMMAHFPMAHVRVEEGRKRDGLVICFGMGTSFRSLASWGGNATAVELVPSVPAMFSYFYPDGPQILSSRDRIARIEVDDGRRWLDRTTDTYDLITVDPPPPLAASGSSLLYSKEFYQAAIRRLKPGGILHNWLPGGDPVTMAAVTLALLESFPHVRVFGSVEAWGYHYLASRDPIPSLTAEALLQRMPAAAVRDMVEWTPNIQPLSYFAIMLHGEVDPTTLLLPMDPHGGETMTDDRPANEFFFLRSYVLE